MQSQLNNQFTKLSIDNKSNQERSQPTFIQRECREWRSNFCFMCSTFLPTLNQKNVFTRELQYLFENEYGYTANPYVLFSGSSICQNCSGWLEASKEGYQIPFYPAKWNIPSDEKHSDCYMCLFKIDPQNNTQIKPESSSMIPPTKREFNENGEQIEIIDEDEELDEEEVERRKKEREFYKNDLKRFIHGLEEKHNCKINENLLEDLVTELTDVNL